MVLDPRRRAQKHARKTAKRKQRLDKQRRTEHDFDPGSAQAATAATWPIHECHMADRLFEAGIGSVIVCRSLGNRFAVAVFLLDVFCLGVKDAFFSILSAADYQRFLNRTKQSQPLAPVTPECARKLIEGAVEYASDLGFQPHKDYHSAKALLDAIDTTSCDTTFRFGRDGKPFYCSGPFEGSARRKQILDKLKKRFGPDGFGYLVGIGDS